MSRTEELIAKEMAKPGTRGKINAHCLDCTYDELAPGNWVQQIDRCTITSCALYSIRKRSKPHKPKEGQSEGV